MTPKQKNAFLASLRQIPVVAAACMAANISRAWAYRLRKSDPSFALEWDEAIEEGVEAAEIEMHRRGVIGYPGRPVVHKGRVVREITEYSDALLLAWVRAHRPDKYRDNSKIELHNGVKDPSKMTEEEVTAELVALARQTTADDFSDLV